MQCDLTSSRVQGAKLREFKKGHIGSAAGYSWSPITHHGDANALIRRVQASALAAHIGGKMYGVTATTLVGLTVGILAAGEKLDSDSDSGRDDGCVINEPDGTEH